MSGKAADEFRRRGAAPDSVQGRNCYRRRRERVDPGVKYVRVTAGGNRAGADSAAEDRRRGRPLYTLVTRDTRELDFAHHRQMFLTEQGYSYSILDETECGAPVTGVKHAG